jgi:PAS domain-containing protein
VQLQGEVVKTVQERNPQHRCTRVQHAGDDLHLLKTRFESLVELSGGWYWEQDENLRFTCIESSSHCPADADPRQYLGKTLWQCDIAPESQTPAWEQHQAAVQARKPFDNLLLRQLDARGQRRYLRASGQPIFDRMSRFQGYRGIATDVTAVMRADRLLRLEHQVARCLAEAVDAVAALKAVIRAVCETKEWQCGRYFRVDHDADVLRFSEAWGVADPAVERFIERSRNLTFVRGAGLNGRVWESGQSIWIADQTKDARVFSRTCTAMPARAAHSYFRSRWKERPSACSDSAAARSVSRTNACWRRPV